MEDSKQQLEIIVLYNFLYEKQNLFYITKLKPEMFEKKEYFKKMQDLYINNKFDTLEMLKFDTKYTCEIQDKCLTTADFNNALNKLKDLYNKKIIKNKLILALNKINKDDMTALDIISGLVKDTEIDIDTNFFDNSQEISQKTLDYLENYNKMKKINIGVTDIDKIIGGFQKGNLVIISARPSAGKTTFAIQTAINMAKNNLKVLFLSLEMSVEELGVKIYSRMTSIDSKELLCNYTNHISDIANCLNKFTNLNFNIDEKTQYIENIISNIRFLKEKENIDVVFVDYIGLIKSREKSFSRENEVAKISRDFKLLAKELGIVIVLLSQLNRMAENVEPSLAMLRESGSLEQDANKVIFLYQEEKYKDSTNGILNIKIAKNREGNKGKVEVAFNKSIRFNMPFTKIIKKIQQKY